MKLSIMDQMKITKSLLSTLLFGMLALASCDKGALEPIDDDIIEDPDNFFCSKITTSQDSIYYLVDGNEVWLSGDAQDIEFPVYWKETGERLHGEWRLYGGGFNNDASSDEKNKFPVKYYTYMSNDWAKIMKQDDSDLEDVYNVRVCLDENNTPYTRDIFVNVCTFRRYSATWEDYNCGITTTIHQRVKE